MIKPSFFVRKAVTQKALHDSWAVIVKVTREQRARFSVLKPHNCRKEAVEVLKGYVAFTSQEDVEVAATGLPEAGVAVKRLLTAMDLARAGQQEMSASNFHLAVSDGENVGDCTYGGDEEGWDSLS